MPRNSKQALSKYQLEKLKTFFNSAITNLKGKNETKDFFAEFLTPGEEIMITKRLMLFIFLTNGYPEDYIKTLLHLSHETIRTYRNLLPHKPKKFHTLLQKIKNGRKTDELIDAFKSMAKKLTQLTQIKSNMKIRTKIRSREIF